MTLNRLNPATKPLKRNSAFVSNKIIILHYLRIKFSAFRAIYIWALYFMLSWTKWTLFCLGLLGLQTVEGSHSRTTVTYSKLKHKRSVKLNNLSAIIWNNFHAFSCVNNMVPTVWNKLQILYQNASSVRFFSQV